MSQSRSNLLVLGTILPSAEAQLESVFDLTSIHGLDELSTLTDDQLAAIAGIVTFGHIKIDAALLDKVPNARMVGNFGVGYDTVDAKTCAARGLVVTNTPDVLTDETADTAVGLLLMTVREFPKAEQHLRAGKWPKGGYPLTPTTLRDRTVGIAGLGRIGKAVARRLEGFSVKIAYSGRRKQDDVSYTYYPSVLEMAAAVDTLVSVLPGSAETQHVLNADVFKALGPSGVFVNIGRGSVVQEADLIAALHDGTIAAAGLDVFENEPNINQAFLDAPNTVLLPHVGSASQHTRQEMGRLLTDNVERFFADGCVYTPVPECKEIAKVVERPD